MVRTANKGILKYLYKYKDKWAAVDARINDLRSTGKKDDSHLANLLSEFKEMVTDLEFRQKFDKTSNDVCDMIDKKYPELQYRLDSREKSLVRVDDKATSLIVENQEKPKNLRLENPLKRICDFFALRIILADDNPEELIKELYALAEDVIEFFLLSEDFEVCIAQPVKGTKGFKRKKFPNIYVPQKSLLKEDFKKYVKDYVVNPKGNGYQSLHFVILDKKTGFRFEIQLRTHSMHIHAEISDEANHDAFRNKQNQKMKELKNHKKIKYKKIKIRGFKATGNKTRPYDDQLGILDSLPMLQRSKTTNY